MKKIELSRKKILKHLEKQQDSGNRCYVCGSKRKKDSVDIGQGKFRCADCYAGSKKWKKHRKKSKLYKYFKEETNEEIVN